MSTAIITGASRGFGLALARELALDGWDLVIDARTGADLADAAEGLREAVSGSVVSIPGDVTDPSHRQELIEAATGLGSFELLVNNASSLGPSPLPTLATYPTGALAEVFAVNVVAPLQLVQEAMVHLRSSQGTVVNITSDAAVEAYEGWGGYGATKAALEQLSNVMAAEEPLLRVYWFDPGDMRTRMHQDAFPGEDISDRPLPEERVPALVRLIKGDYPSGRYTAESLLAEMALT